MTPHERLYLPDDITDGMGALAWGLAAVLFFAIVGAVVCFRAVVGLVL
jgi:hypothetical protein